MNQELTLKITLERPPAGVDFGLQKGSGNNYEVLQKQRSPGEDLHFTFPITVKLAKDGSPNFLGPFVQGPPSQRFVYINIGQSAGQYNSAWNRRLKVPLTGIALETINELATNDQLLLQATVPGTGKDNGPNCATVKPFAGWHIAKRAAI